MTKSLPYNIATSSAATWGQLKSQIGANFGITQENDSELDLMVQILALEVIGPQLLPSSPTPCVTGVGTMTFTVASGTSATVPQGASGSYTGVVPVRLTSQLTQGAITNATNYVWLRQKPDGTRDLVVTTTNTPPDHSLLIATATVGATQISAITERTRWSRPWS